jgi:hypothetical protein
LTTKKRYSRPLCTTQPTTNPHPPTPHQQPNPPTTGRRPDPVCRARACLAATPPPPTRRGGTMASENPTHHGLFPQDPTGCSTPPDSHQPPARSCTPHTRGGVY